MTDKPFVERWAARKAATREQQRAEPPPEAPVEAAAEAPALDPPAPITEAELAALPPVETLIAGSDIRAFLRPGVPAALKNAALRKMWLATPAIRDHKDIAVDYAWDWNTPGGVPGDGGPLDPVRVAQWVRELAGKPAPDGGEVASHASPGKAKAAPVADPPDVAAAAPRPAPREEPKAAGARDTAAARDAPSEAPETPARPRHGGARPG